MAMRSWAWLAGLVGPFWAASGCSSQPSDPKDGAPEGAATRAALSAAGPLRNQFPSARSSVRGDVQRRLSGQRLAVGGSPLEAATRFSEKLAGALGVGKSELQAQELVGGQATGAANPQGIGLMFDRATGKYKYRLYRFGQTRGGLPVVDSEVLALVREGDPLNSVVWGSSRLRELNSFSPVNRRAATPDLGKTLRAVRPASGFAGVPLAAPTSLTQVGATQRVIYAGSGEQQLNARAAISYVVQSQSPPGKWRVIADENSLDVLSAESLIVFDDVSGTVSGLATTGVKAMECADELPVALPFAEVVGDGGSAFTDASGAFSFSASGSGPVTLNSALGGQFFDVFNAAQSGQVLTQTITPPGPASFLHNADNLSTLVRAEVNGYFESNQIRAFLLSYLPDYPTISAQLNFPVNVNLTGGLCPGNAWYDYASINFCQGSTSNANTSFGSVNHHEYGHHIVTSGGSGQGAYGEGMSDTIAALFAKDPGLGYGFFLNACATPLRTAQNDCQYSATACSSCGGGSHACGNLLSGTIWSIRQALLASNPEGADEILRPLVLSSIPMHTGTVIDASIAEDLLTLDDDDGNIANGTPHYAEICSGFAAHGMQCPPVLVGIQVSPPENFTAEGPVGGPFTPVDVSYTLRNYGPEPSAAYHVSPVGSVPWLSIENPSGELAIGQEAQVTIAVDQASAATLPKGDYVATVGFSNVTNGNGGGTRQIRLQVGVPSVVFSETFESGLGAFTLGAEPTNRWHVSSACAASSSGHSLPNALFFGVDASCDFNTGARSEGSVTSPVISIADPSRVLLGLNYYLATERSSVYDKASISASINGGPFTIVAKNGTAADLLKDGNSTWQRLELDLTSSFPTAGPATLQLRAGFDTVDSVANTYAGFWLDDIQVRAFTQPCAGPADCSDGLFCNGVEQCTGGVCSAGMAVACDDGVACTIDACDEETGACVSQPDNAACSDANACNGVELCGASGCVAGTPLDCNDGNLCTADSCSPGAGCVQAPVSCDDGNVCTSDSCSPSAGCQFSNNTAPCADDGNACTQDICAGGQCTHPPAGGGSCGTGPFLESGGSVVIEAEHFSTSVSRANHAWTLQSDGSAGGGQLMSASPNNGANVNTGYTNGSPQLDFPIKFSTTGTYYVWLRGAGPTGDDDSCHVGLDGQGPGSSDRIGSFPTSLGWTRATMDGPVATITVSTVGIHTLNLWMREDGLKVDRLLLTTNNGFTPSGLGPAESPRQSAGCTSAADCNDGNACTSDVCTAGACQNPAVPDSTACADDGNACTGDVCSAGVCTHPNSTAPCADDGSACTSDVCSGGVCTHPPNGSCGSTPCSAYCQNPVNFSGSLQAGNIGVSATCHQTTSNITSGNCGNFASPRALFVNGVQMACTGGNWGPLPPKVNGGYCIHATAGNHPWAYITAW